LGVCLGFRDFALFSSTNSESADHKYRGADNSLARPGRKQARKNVRDARDFNNIETRAVIKIFFLQGKAPKEIHAILTETLACFDILLTVHFSIILAVNQLHAQIFFIISLLYASTCF
jgi:hypothetical protein